MRVKVRRRMGLLVVPFVTGYLAWKTGILALKLGVPGLCTLLLVLGDGPIRRHRDVGWVVLAFLASIVGDTFLSTRAGRESFYIAGIAAFFMAHIGYLGFALKNGRLHGPVLVVLMAGYLGWFAVQLGPAIRSVPLKTAALVYLLISCTALAAACGLRCRLAVKTAYVAGIGLIVFSDTLIALSDFMKVKGVSFLILPTYYLAHIVVTWAVLRREQGAEPSVR
jgi:uncharacterized membrane protein YhhN